MKKGIIGIIMVLGLSLVLISGCGGGSDKKVDIPPPTELLTNNDPGFETEGAAGNFSTWYPDNGCTLAVASTAVHGGSYACNVTQRSHTYSACSTVIKDILITNGPGTYRVKFYAKVGTAGQGDSVQPVISLFTPGWAGYYPSGSSPLTDINDTTWTLVTGDIILPAWTSGSLSNAIVSFAGSNDTEVDLINHYRIDILVDDFSITKIN